MTDLYVNPHLSQYGLGTTPITRHTGCTWTAGANGVDASTGGRLHPTPDEVHALLPLNEETSPGTPGWSLPDLVNATGRLGLTLEDRTGSGWVAAVQAVEAGHYVVLQGISAAFGDHTCSGAFDGAHAIGWHPRHRITGGVPSWWINDPVCREGRWEREDVLRRYASSFWAGIRFAVFAVPVPVVPPRVTWGSDVLPETRAVTSAATARSAIRKAGHEPGLVIGEGDLRAACRHERIPYGTRVNPTDLRRLLAATGVQP